MVQVKSRNRKRKRKLSITLSLMMLTILLGAGLFYVLGNKNIFQQGNAVHSVKKELQALNLSSQNNQAPAMDLQLNSSEFLLMKLNTGEVITENAGDERIYPASMTKIMTALLALEKLPDLDQKIQLTEDIYPELYSQNASRAGFEPGEMATVRDLVYGVMLPSGAECCLGLANQITGSEAAFVDMMNQKAAELGLTNTHFTNSTGLHNEEHYSTAKDMAVLLQYSLQNGDFRAVFTSPRHTTTGTNYHPEGFTFASTLFKYTDNLAVTGGELLGGKTGYTSEAGQCLASLANVGGEDYILVTAGAHGNAQEEQLHIQDAFRVYSKLGEAIEAGAR